MSESQPSTRDAVSPEQLHSSSNRYSAALTSLDPERIAGCFAPEGELEDPVGSGVRRGREQITQYWQRMCALVADLPVEVVTSQVAGDSIAVHWRTSAEAKNGRRASAEGIDVLQIDANGLIVRAEGYWDQQGFIGALMG